MEENIHNTDKIDKIMRFNNYNEAFDFLVNKHWDTLSLEERKILRPHKSNFNHRSVSMEKMQEVLSKFGFEININIQKKVANIS